MLDSGSLLNADDIVITNGSQSGMSLALLAVCQPGTLSPLNPHLLRHNAATARPGIKVIEIPTDPDTGISIEALELALDQWPIKGVLLVPNCNNPLGFIMPDARKRAVLALAQRHDIVILKMMCMANWPQSIRARVRSTHGTVTAG